MLLSQCEVWKFLLIGQNRSTNQRSGMILEAQIQIFEARKRKSFHLKKNPRVPNINISYLFVSSVQTIEDLL